MPAIRQIQRRGWCPTTTTTSVGLQIMLQAVRFTYLIVSNTINSEPTNIDRPDIGSAAGAARIWRSRRRAVARGFRPDVGKTLKASTKKNVAPAVVRYVRSISNSFVFNRL